MKNIKELKNICHYHFDKYVQSTLRAYGDKKHYHKRKKNAYHRLAQELKTDAFKCHFSNMNTMEELQRALSVIKKWSGGDQYDFKRNISK